MLEHQNAFVFIAPHVLNTIHAHKPWNPKTRRLIWNPNWAPQSRLAIPWTTKFKSKKKGGNVLNTSKPLRREPHVSHTPPVTASFGCFHSPKHPYNHQSMQNHLQRRKLISHGDACSPRAIINVAHWAHGRHQWAWLVVDFLWDPKLSDHNWMNPDIQTWIQTR